MSDKIPDICHGGPCIAELQQVPCHGEPCIADLQQMPCHGEPCIAGRAEPSQGEQCTEEPQDVRGQYFPPPHHWRPCIADQDNHEICHEWSCIADDDNVPITGNGKSRKGHSAPNSTAPTLTRGVQSKISDWFGRSLVLT